ncbi:MAG: SUMF1/EgtB/PvdO family nonheme iron enzyme [Rhabdochlamydiaceae bacterium]|nr:SUMF1/EgtB/PvdO family nonheme iron enzyme [Rhabdochlamydiaceae bacterium]
MISQLEEYVLIREINKSPLGTLYLAEHHLLKRKVALKFLSPALRADFTTFARFQEEIALLASLEHPYIARLQNVGLQEDSCYVAYDWLSSNEEPCKTLYDYTGADESLLFSFACQIASALDAIHRFQICGAPASHLGVKGSNVLIHSKEGKLTASLTDTGLMRLLSPGSFLLLLLQECAQEIKSAVPNASRRFWQSFHALSPEQKLQNALSLEASDVYAFGVMFYDILTGQMPEGRFPLPSEVRPDLRYDWDSLLLSCLDPHPEMRPKELEAAVEKIASASPRSTAISIPSLKLQLKPTEIVRPQFEPDPGAIFQTENVVVRYQPVIQETKAIDPIATEMVIIPGGEFYRGSNQGGRDESPRHQIHLDPFALDIHPVTNEQLVRFLEVMGGEKDGNNNDIIRLRESRIKRSGGKLIIESGYAKHPVVGVTWYGACAYARWVGKRLPTEAEWEIAACGTIEEALYPTGATLERSQANFFSADTTAVMSYPENAYGLYDMAGNVYEWCNDWYDFHYYNQSVQEPNNPKGPLQGVYRVLRGGCWKSLKEDMRCAHRHRNNPGTMNGTCGFRCAADVKSL